MELLNVIVRCTEETDIIILPEQRVSDGFNATLCFGTICLQFWSTHSCRNKMGRRFPTSTEQQWIVVVLMTCGISIGLSFVVQRIIDLSLICASRVLIGDVGSRKQLPTPDVGVLLICLSLSKDPSF